MGEQLHHLNFSPQAKLPQIVIVGGGAGGLELASYLGRSLGKRNLASILLIDRNFSHVWKPLLHEVAAGTLDTPLSEINYLSHAQEAGYHFWPGTLEGIDRANRLLRLAPYYTHTGKLLFGSKSVPYDLLILSLGSQTQDYQIPGVREHCHFIDTRAQAEAFNSELRDTVLATLAEEAPSKLSILIVGGGATGVELAAELKRMFDLISSYGPVYLRHSLKLTLVEGANRILSALPEPTSVASRRVLEQIGVHVLTGARIAAVDEQGVILKEGGYLQGNLKVWAAGIKASPLLATLDGLEVNHIGQLVVNEFLQTTQDASILAFGDCAQLDPNRAAYPWPATAQLAHQQARYLKKAVLLRIQGLTVPAFRFHPFGYLVSLSRYDAFGRLGRLGILPAWYFSGMLARWSYSLLYRRHQIVLHGFWHALLIIFSEKVRQLIKPSIKISS